MKNKKFLMIALAFLMTGCGSKDITPKITNKKDSPFEDKKADITYGDLYDELYTSAGNSQIFNWVTMDLAKRLNIPQQRADDIAKRVKDTQKDWMKNSSYYFNDLFHEQKLANSFRSLGYNITCDNGYFTATDKDNNPWSQDETQKLELYKGDVATLKCNYSDYIEKALYPTIYQAMIEEQYIIEDRLQELEKFKRVRKIETLSFTKDSGDIKVASFVNKVSKSLKGYEVSFSEFAYPYEKYDPDTGDWLSGYVAADSIIPLAERNKFTTYEYIWKNYLKSLNDKEIRKIGTLGDVEFETEEAKKANEEEKRSIINKYTGNGAYSQDRGMWLASLDIDKVEYVKEDTYSTDSAPFSDTLKATLFNKNPNGQETSGDPLFAKIYQKAGFDYIKDVNSYGDETDEDIILYQTDNTNNKYVFIRLINAYEEQSNDVNKYETAKAYAPTLSINKKAYVKYFEQYNVQFGSTDIYNYFVTNYPEYFE